jgi:hypothetical protein
VISLGEVLEHAVACSDRGPRLRDCPLAEPTAEQRTLIERAIADARAALPLPSRMTVHCRRRRADPGVIPPGETWRDATIHVAIDRPTSAVLETLFHECQHLSDFHVGLADRLGRVEFERRAIAFAARMMAGWAWR